MFGRQTTGSVVCVSCGNLVGVNDERCYSCGRRYPGLWGFAPVLRGLGQDMGFVPFVTGACVILYVLTLIYTVSQGGSIAGSGLNMLSPSSYAVAAFGAAGATPVFRLDRWWTVLSASWLHGGILHLLFNMYWIRLLAPDVGELYGPGRMVIIYTIAGVLGFTASSVAGAVMPAVPILGGAGLTVGASASIFGLLGAVIYYGRRTGSRAAHGQAVNLAVIMFVFGLIMPGVDNYAHGGGFLGGYLAARWLDPLQPERINHMLGALVCLVLSIGAVVLSFVHWLLIA